MDFIRFKKETLRWVAAQPQAQQVKEEWEEDPEWSHENKVYLEETCILWLQRYLSYRKEVVEKIEPPVGKVTHKVVDDSLEVLICQAFGFYPKEIQATWTRDGENWEHETFRGTVAPNSDGTYYYWISIEIQPEEKNRFWCHLEHDGLQNPLVLAWKEETAPGWLIPVGIVAGLILGAVILFLIYRCWRRRTILCQEGRPSSVDFSLAPVYLPFTSDIEEDEIQSKPMRKSKLTIEAKASLWKSGQHFRPQRDFKNTGLTVRKREGKAHRSLGPWVGVVGSRQQVWTAEESEDSDEGPGPSGSGLLPSEIVMPLVDTDSEAEEEQPTGSGHLVPEVGEEAGEGQGPSEQAEEDPGPSPIHPLARREERIREKRGLLRRRGPRSSS